MAAPATKLTVALHAKKLTNEELTAFASAIQGDACSKAELQEETWFNKVEALFDDDGELPRAVKDAVFVLVQQRACVAAAALCAEELEDHELVAFALSVKLGRCSKADLQKKPWFNERIEELFDDDGELSQAVKDAVFALANTRMEA
ncbi:hypothetical protein CL629_01025 [bacterium]|nr:hypothetical protein [bacterium]